MSPVDALRPHPRDEGILDPGDTEEYGGITDAPGAFPVVAHGISDDVPTTPST